MLNFTLPDTGFPIFVDGFVFPSYFHYYEYLRYGTKDREEVGSQICSLRTFEEVIDYSDNNDWIGGDLLWRFDVGASEDIMNMEKAVHTLLEQNSGLINSLIGEEDILVEQYLSEKVLKRLGDIKLNEIWEEYRDNYRDWACEGFFENL